jgi:hypothetical protein
MLNVLRKNLLNGRSLALVRSFSGKGPSGPSHPTMSESFGTKIPKEYVEKLLDPKGFMQEGQKDKYTEVTEKIETLSTKPKSVLDKYVQDTKVESDATKPVVALEQLAKEDFFDQDKKICADNGVGEQGLKLKGPEATRYGDWSTNGRCFDF